jgi:hypothetical protein
MVPKTQVKALWDTKDKLEVLAKDPMRLHKELFVDYLKAKGEAMMDEGEPHEAIQAYLTQLTVEWKAEAKAIYERRQAIVATRTA